MLDHILAGLLIIVGSCNIVLCWLLERSWRRNRELSALMDEAFGKDDEP